MATSEKRGVAAVVGVGPGLGAALARRAAMSPRTFARAFAADVLKHVRDIAERYIVPGETAESALMFLPSEAVYAELHASFADVVDKSYKARVWIVSPTTLNRKCPGSMMPAWTGPTATSAMPSP